MMSALVDDTLEHRCSYVYLFIMIHHCKRNHGNQLISFVPLLCVPCHAT